MRSSIVAVAIASVCAACAPTAHHPSAAADDALARQDERAARQHLTSAHVILHRQGACGEHGAWEDCWTANDDPDRVAAEEHMRSAMKERAAAQSLRDAQTRACAGVGPRDREVSPFTHVKDIANVEPIARGERLVGAKVTFRHIDGLTPEALQRIVDCHVAQADALGHDVPGESFCPLNLPDVKATVTAAAAGYDVAIVTDDAPSAKEVLRRAVNLLR